MLKHFCLEAFKLSDCQSASYLIVSKCENGATFRIMAQQKKEKGNKKRNESPFEFDSNTVDHANEDQKEDDTVNGDNEEVDEDYDSEDGDLFDLDDLDMIQDAVLEGGDEFREAALRAAPQGQSIQIGSKVVIRHAWWYTDLRNGGNEID